MALGEALEFWFTVHAAPVSLRLEGEAEASRARRPPRMGGPARQTAYRRNPDRRFDKAEQRPSSPQSAESPWVGARGRLDFVHLDWCMASGPGGTIA